MTFQNSPESKESHFPPPWGIVWGGAGVVWLSHTCLDNRSIAVQLRLVTRGRLTVRLKKGNTFSCPGCTFHQHIRWLPSYCEFLKHSLGGRFLSCDVAPAGCALTKRKKKRKSAKLTKWPLESNSLPYICQSGFRPKHDQTQRACKKEKNTPRTLMSLSNPDFAQISYNNNRGRLWMHARPSNQQ